MRPRTLLAILPLAALMLLSQLCTLAAWAIDATARRDVLLAQNDSGVGPGGYEPEDEALRERIMRRYHKAPPASAQPPLSARPSGSVPPPPSQSGVGQSATPEVRATTKP